MGVLFFLFNTNFRLFLSQKNAYTRRDKTVRNCRYLRKTLFPVREGNRTFFALFRRNFSFPPYAVSFPYTYTPRSIFTYKCIFSRNEQKKNHHIMTARIHVRIPADGESEESCYLPEVATYWKLLHIFIFRVRISFFRRRALREA